MMRLKTLPKFCVYYFLDPLLIIAQILQTLLHMTLASLSKAQTLSRSFGAKTHQHGTESDSCVEMDAVQRDS